MVVRIQFICTVYYRRSLPLLCSCISRWHKHIDPIEWAEPARQGSYTIHVKSCHSCQIMPFMSNHAIHVKSCILCKIMLFMSFMSNCAIHVKSCQLCKIMPIMQNHANYAKSCQLCQILLFFVQIMSFMSNHLIHVKSCH
jgi:hypothetical protein